MSGIAQDLEYGLRLLRKSPVATAVAVLALALGTGVNISSFVSVNALVLHPMPYPHLERIVTVWEAVTESLSQRYFLTPATFLDWKRQSRSFKAVAAYAHWEASLTGINEPVRVKGARVDPAFFEILGTAPALGRTFAAYDAQAGKNRVAVVSEGFWRRQLAGSPQAVGHSLAINGESYTVVGVMPSELDFPLATDLWTPLILADKAGGDRTSHSLAVIASLQPGVTIAQANAEALDIARRIAKQYPQTNEARTLRVISLRQITNEVTRRFILILLGSAAFVLLLACANVGNLQLAAAARREKEISIRTALGASRAQIARQLFLESILLTLLGSFLGLVLASWDVALTKANLPPEVFAFVTGMRDLRVDAYVLGYALALSLVAGTVCCLPAIFQLLSKHSQADIAHTLKEGGRTSRVSSSRNRMQSLLIAYEVAMALVLLIGTGFMIKMFRGMVAADYGYDPKNLLTFQVSLPSSTYGDDAQLIDFYGGVLHQLETLPGSRSAAIWAHGPIERLVAEGRPEPRPGEPRPEVQPVSPGLLESLKVPLLMGRFLSAEDRSASPHVLVLSQSVARYYWPNSNPVGQRIKLGAPSSPWLTVAGVCGNIVEDWFTGRPSLTAYVPYTQRPPRTATLVIRTALDPTRFAPSARAAVRAVDRNLPLYDVKSKERMLFEESSGVRAAASAMTTYSIVSLILAATGIFSVISFFVAERTRDIGVRIALGASGREIQRNILSRMLRPTALGLAVGLAAAFALTKVLSSVLYNLVKLDWFTFAGCAILLGTVAFLASLIPALRASRIDPLVTLRQE